MKQWWGRQDKENARKAASYAMALWKRTKWNRKEKKQENQKNEKMKKVSVKAFS